MVETHVVTLALGAALGAALTLFLLRRAEGKRCPLGPLGQRRSGKYHAGMCKLKPSMALQYRQLHDRTWEDVMARMYASNMRDFTVWLHEETNTMFHQFVYIGTDFEADMAAVGADPVVRFWWSFCEPCQEPLHWTGLPPSQGGRGMPSHPGEWWSPMSLVNHCGAWATAWSKEWPDPHFSPTHPEGLTTTKDSPPSVHNRVGEASSWTSYTQAPYDVSVDAPDSGMRCPNCKLLRVLTTEKPDGDQLHRCAVCNYRYATTFFG